MKSLWVGLILLSAGLLCRAQQGYRLDPARSVIQIHLDTAGALGFMGHPHLIQATIEQGNFIDYPEDRGKSSVEVVVDAGALRVLDPKLSAKHRQEVQATMQSGRVLDAKRYPKIIFKSLKIESLSGNRLQLTGNLTLRNQTHPVIVEATLEPVGPALKASGTSHFNQTTFGIRPVAVGLGTVRVQDQVNISFQMIAQPKPNHASAGPSSRVRSSGLKGLKSRAMRTFSSISSSFEMPTMTVLNSSWLSGALATGRRPYQLEPFLAGARAPVSAFSP